MSDEIHIMTLKSRILFKGRMLYKTYLQEVANEGNVAAVSCVIPEKQKALKDEQKTLNRCYLLRSQGGSGAPNRNGGTLSHLSR